MQAELAGSTNTSISLLRLSQNLRALIRSISGEQPPPSPENYEPPTPEDALLSYITDFDWATERETEISRLEQENEHLRQMLGIDEASAERNGLLADEERERERFFPSSSSSLSSLSSSRSSNSGSFKSDSGLILGGSPPIPGSPRPPPSGLSMNNVPQPPPIPNLQQPPPLPMLRNPDYSQPMRGGSSAGRRSAIFGQRGGGPFFGGGNAGGMASVALEAGR